ncbi:FAD-dependent oxidoreductase [Ramlibacter tataouinensis]|nr:FAD-dependent oxidoreductase [Ramlibacter tataouinensis]
MKDALVIGGGPAGAACALWLHQLGMATMLIEGGAAIGGLQQRSPYMNRWIPGLVGKTGQEVARQLHMHLRQEQVECLLNYHVVSVRRRHAAAPWEVSNGSDVHRARYIVIATGTRPRTGGFAESECVGIGPGTSIEKIPVQGKRMAVLGGGDAAFEQAEFALRRGARCVDLYCRRAPRARPALRQRLQGLAAHVHAGPFHADQKTMRVNDQQYDVFSVQYGYEACIPVYLELPRKDGYLEVDQSGAIPGVPGLFAAGSVTNFLHPCVTTAAAHGIQVAKVIENQHCQHGAQAARSADRPQQLHPLGFLAVSGI